MASKNRARSEAPTSMETEGSITQGEIDDLLERERSNADEITLDETFDLLRNQRRRDVLIYLAETADNTATVGELAEHVAAKENDIDKDQLSSTQRKRVYIGLYQCHLPKMDDLDVIEYDQDRGTVVLQNNSRLFSYLPGTEETTERSRAPLYSALVVGLLVTVGLLGIGPVAAVPVAAWAALSTGALVVVALYHSELWDVDV